MDIETTKLLIEAGGSVVAVILVVIPVIVMLARQQGRMLDQQMQHQTIIAEKLAVQSTTLQVLPERFAIMAMKVQNDTLDEEELDELRARIEAAERIERGEPSWRNGRPPDEADEDTDEELSETG